jgi:hypothetical protein
VDAASLAALWAGLEAGVRRHAAFPPPPPTSSVLAAAAGGHVGRAALPGGGVVAWGVLPVPKTLVWLTLTDDHLADDVDALTEVALEGRWAQPKLLYQRIDLPWPFADRHWVLRLRNNGALAAETGAWERSWSVEPDALPGARARTDAARFDASEALTVNHGAWLLVSLDETHTLGIYQAATELGGNIPAEAADTWARSSLTGLYAGLETHARVVSARYGPGCSPQPGADGVPIPCFR